MDLLNIKNHDFIIDIDGLSKLLNINNTKFEIL